ncbi:carbohydrate-binding module family 20 domain-containing protein [Amphibacillus sediminis]|uniref:carbohydrate-binding module family 20 domain-containing protein n=1 Tax=Amphibacillus sediminis TaxID=360185 RepID=UPI00082D4798|nr:carbohydrate-binding module family 20 domain-containing protein [Amphibacillus sediminis]
MRKRLLYSVVLIVTVLLSGFLINSSVQASESERLTEQRMLPANPEDGAIFHAWNWSFDTIRENLEALAEAGFNTVQTSPIQGVKEPLISGSQWWILYQPINFRIGNSQLGDREAFRRLCEAAEQYGINIIVDVIANHMGNAGGGDLKYTPSPNVDPVILNNPDFWREARGVENWNDRYQVTHWGIGLPDLNTANQELQDMVIDFLNEAIQLGVDGFRFDAAKHIELPNDVVGSNFWPRVLGSLTNRDDLFIYGEVLQGGADHFTGYAEYMHVTPSHYGDRVRSAVGFNSNRNVHETRNYGVNVDPSKLVTWVESHDTYANDSEESTAMTEWQLRMGWALIASRAQSTPLYFNRPAGSGKFATQLGTAGNEWWRHRDIVAVNHFRNAMVGEEEYLRPLNNDLMLIERGSKGMTIINLGGQTGINSATNLADGSYTNKASGQEVFTVSNGRITGTISAGRIAVLYDGEDNEDGEPDHELVPVTFNINNATTNWGQNIYIVGDLAELGSWEPSRAVAAAITNYPSWQATVYLPIGTRFEFKAIKRNGDQVDWESGNNRVHTVTANQNVINFNFNH